MSFSTAPMPLHLEPDRELVFKGPFDKVTTTYLHLKNPTHKSVAFKVKTTAPKEYCVRPNCGELAPYKDIHLAVMLQPPSISPQTGPTQHKFMIQACYLSPGMVGDEKLWKGVSPEEIMTTKLRVHFREPSSILPQPVAANVEKKEKTLDTAPRKAAGYVPAQRSSPVAPKSTIDPVMVIFAVVIAILIVLIAFQLN